MILQHYFYTTSIPLHLICGDSDTEGSKVGANVGFSDRKTRFCSFADAKLYRDLQLYPDLRGHLLILQPLLGLTTFKQMSAQSLRRT